MNGITAYRTWSRTEDALTRALIKRSFRSWGSRSIVQRPLRVWGEKAIELGDDVFLGAGSWLQAFGSADGEPRISIRDGVRAAGSLTVSCAGRIIIERDVLLARNVYIADHRHSFNDRGVPIREQGISDIRPITLGEGCWIGQNVVILPGVTVGRGSVVGANSVVTQSLPSRVVAVGAPARVRRSIDAPRV